MTESQQNPAVPALAAMIPFLSEADKLRGYKAVMNALQTLGVVRFDPETARLHFRAAVVSEPVLDREVQRHLGDW